jgi:ankyrin repeat protein
MGDFIFTQEEQVTKQLQRGEHPAIPQGSYFLRRFFRVLFILALIFSPLTVWAGECITSDGELLAARKAFYQSAKTQGIGELDEGWGLSCWRHDEGLDDQLKAVLVEMMSDSRIHPAYVAEAANDYAMVFGDMPAFEHHGIVVKGSPQDWKLALQKAQGPARYALIRPKLKNALAPVGTEVEATGNVDYIDGPANIRNAPKGKLVASLPDNTRVRVLQEQAGWVEIATPEARGWTHHKNLMGWVIGEQDAQGFLPLGRAAYLGYADTVDFLLRKGADVNAVDGFGRSALHWAVLGTSHDLGGAELAPLKKLCSLQGIAVNQRDAQGETALFMAVQQMNLGVVKQVLGIDCVDVNIVDNDGTAPLVLAIGWNRKDIFDALVAATDALNINGADNEGVTPLAFAVSSGPGFVPALLQFQGIDIERADKEGRTPLFRAVANRDPKTARLLLERGARVDVVDHEGNNLLLAYLDNRDPYKRNQGQELFELLVKDPQVAADRPDVHGIPPLYRAITQGWVDGVRMLLTHSDVDVNRRFKGDSYHCDESYLRLTLDSLGLEHTREMALLLLDRQDIDVNVEITNDHMTPIFFPHDMWHGEKYSLAIAEKILAHKPILELENKYGETPLTSNIKQGNVKMVELLLKAGADINHSYNGSKGGVYWGPSMTPLKYAEKWGKADVVALLKQAAAQDYQLLGDPAVSPEGIPQQLLQNPSANEAIRFYRSYLVETSEAAIKQIEAGNLDEAIGRQEFILDEIVAEVGASMPKFSREQRQLARKMFATIQAYYDSYPRSGSKWFQKLPAEKKKAYAQLDAERAAVLATDYSAMPEGELADHPPMVPILILRNYMAQNSIAALEMIRRGEADKAARMLSDVAAKSQKKY